MLLAGFALFTFGYALVYSGLSNILSDGNGWGLIQSLTGKGGNTPLLNIGGTTSGLYPLTPSSATSPVTGSVQA